MQLIKLADQLCNGIFGKTEVKEKMQETFSIDEGDSAVIHAQFKKRGWQNVVIGIGAILIAATGIWRIVVGSRQLR